MDPVDRDFKKELFDKISKNDFSAAKSLLSMKDLKPDIYDESGMTPLQHAAYRGNKEIVRLLLDQGANVDSGKHEYGYTALHFAALSGNTEVCQLLLENGAKSHATNSIGRTPSQMAAFVGNTDCVVVINNFVPKSDIKYYTEISGLEKEPKLPPHLVEPLHRFVMQVNLNPVKIAMNLQKCVSVYENIDKIRNVLELMSEREMKRGFETNEIMSFKFHYLSQILAEISKIKKAQSLEKEPSNKEGKTMDAAEVFIKRMLVTNNGTKQGQEKFLRECVRKFPYNYCTIYRQMVSTLTRSDVSSALSVIVSAVNGQRGFIDSDNAICATCGQEKVSKKCAKCKYAQYCDRECQRLHWFVHKKSCDRLASMNNETEVKDMAEKQVVINEAKEALLSEMNTMSLK